MVSGSGMRSAGITFSSAAAEEVSWRPTRQASHVAKTPNTWHVPRMLHTIMCFRRTNSDYCIRCAVPCRVRAPATCESSNCMPPDSAARIVTHPPPRRRTHQHGALPTLAEFCPISPCRNDGEQLSQSAQTQTPSLVSRKRAMNLDGTPQTCKEEGSCAEGALFENRWTPMALTRSPSGLQTRSQPLDSW